MPLVLAIEPNLQQAHTVRSIFDDLIAAELVLVGSIDEALGALERAVPDLILVTTLLAPRDEADLTARLRTLDGTEHLQTLTIPQLAPRSVPTPDVPFLRSLRRRRTKQTVGCDPARFADEISSYLARVQEWRSERAERERWSAEDAGIFETRGETAAQELEAEHAGTPANDADIGAVPSGAEEISDSVAALARGLKELDGLLPRADEHETTHAREDESRGADSSPPEPAKQVFGERSTADYEAIALEEPGPPLDTSGHRAPSTDRTTVSPDELLPLRPNVVEACARLARTSAEDPCEPEVGCTPGVDDEAGPTATVSRFTNDEPPVAHDRVDCPTSDRPTAERAVAPHERTDLPGTSATEAPEAARAAAPSREWESRNAEPASVCHASGENMAIERSVDEALLRVAAEPDPSPATEMPVEATEIADAEPVPDVSASDDAPDGEPAFLLAAGVPAELLAAAVDEAEPDASIDPAVLAPPVPVDDDERPAASLPAERADGEPALFQPPRSLEEREPARPRELDPMVLVVEAGSEAAPADMPRPPRRERRRRAPTEIKPSPSPEVPGPIQREAASLDARNRPESPVLPAASPAVSSRPVRGELRLPEPATAPLALWVRAPQAASAPPPATGIASHLSQRFTLPGLISSTGAQGCQLRIRRNRTKARAAERGPLIIVSKQLLGQERQKVRAG